jgi:thiamine-phosphate pyrophosphorylase
MSEPSTTTDSGQPARRLYLFTPPVADPAAFAGDLAAVLEAADIAAVLLRLERADERTLINRVKALAPTVQNRGVALVLDGLPDIVARSGADGAHLTGIDALTEALGALKPDRIAGAGGLHTRHDAMLAGESADYAMFGEPDIEGRRPAFEAIIERVEWWAEVFQPPSVAFAAALDEVAALATAGADFVAVGDCIWSDARGPVAAIGAAAAGLVIPEAVT